VAAYYYEAMVRYGESVLVTDLQGRHHQGRCSGSVGAEGEVGGVALVAQRGRDAGVGAAVAGGVAGVSSWLERAGWRGRRPSPGR
jgi:hypothetical protein